MEKLLGEFSVGLFFWQTLLFVALILLLKKFAWKPILDAVNEREQGIKDALDSAEQAKQEMANLQADNEKLLKEARAERDAMLKEARDIKNKMINDAKEEAKGEADKMVAQAQAAIQSEKKAAIADLKNQVASLSLEIAEKVVRVNLSSDDNQQKLVKNLLDDSSLN
ncbi:F0F1 ATP synthase subunit B [Flavobacteriaceae bacterium]|jgi:F-type H+-transporting ATPase subunit b|nr:F0F1 ATP synthase subunit B [Flavobacteriaceae bacterium]MDB2586573.1 F0F1 ATP synthase subunit B [Flavobacteriaceae bacterium]